MIAQRVVQAETELFHAEVVLPYLFIYFLCRLGLLVVCVDGCPESCGIGEALEEAVGELILDLDISEKLIQVVIRIVEMDYGRLDGIRKPMSLMRDNLQEPVTVEVVIGGFGFLDAVLDELPSGIVF